MSRGARDRDSTPPIAAIFTPDNEPYLGRETLHAFDNLIVVCLEQNATVAPRTHAMHKTDLQWAACQSIPQGISIALSIRELVRQGYLFGASVLIRPLAERAVAVRYLHQFPDEMTRWKEWRKKGRTLHFMLERISHGKFPGAPKEMTQLYNDLIHGNPESAMWSLIEMGDGSFGHGVSKMLNNPQLCDEICMSSAAWLAVLMAMMNAIFPAGQEATKKETV